MDKRDSMMEMSELIVLSLDCFSGYKLTYQR